VAEASDILGGIADTGASLWVAGAYDTGNDNMALLRHN
jgi:hypothetical protein